MKKSVIALSLALSLLFSGSALAAQSFNLVAVGSAAGGVFEIGLAQLGKIITTEYPGSAYKLLPGASASNVLRVSQGGCDVTISQHVLGVAASQGQEPYKEKVTNVRSLLNIGDMARGQFVVADKSEIVSLEQVINNKMAVGIAVGPKGGAGEMAFSEIVKTFGYTYKDMQDWGCRIITNTTSDSVAMMQDGLCDILYWFGPDEGPFLTELATSMKLRWLTLPEDIANKMAADYGFTAHYMPEKLFGGAPGKILCIGNATEFFVNESMPEDIAYELTKVIVENRADLALALPTWATITPDNVCKNLAFPTHPGAARYYTEIGCNP